MSIAVTQFDFGDAAPLWRDAVVGASVAAMAAAAGMAAYYEIGAAPWLSFTVGGATAIALWGAHRQLGGARHIQETRKPTKKPRAAGPAVADDAGMPGKSLAPQSMVPKATGNAAMPSALAPAAPALTPLPLETSPLPYLQSAPSEQRVDLSSFAPRQPQAAIEPRQPQAAIEPRQPQAAIEPRQQQAAIEPRQQQAANESRQQQAAIAPRQAKPENDVSQLKSAHEHAAAPSAAPTARDTPMERDAAASQIDPEAQFLHLQGLVRQLAADVSGPRAMSPDPDRAVLPAREQPPMQVGFASAGDNSAASLDTPTVLTPIARLAEAVAAERFDVLLEPIQRLAEARARHFEISVRFRDNRGDVLEPEDVKRISRNTGLATSIDALKLPRVAKVVQRVQSRGGAPADVLAALAGASLADHAFMESLAAAFPVGVPGTLVLSFPQADVRAFARVHWSALTALADMGLRFALEDVSDLDMDFELLRARQFVFAKLDAAIFLGGLPCAGDVVPSADICRHVETAGLELIVSGIDNEDQMNRLTPYGVPFGQGKLFGGARPVKADILR